VTPAPTLAALERLLAQGGMFHRCGSGALSLAGVAAGRLLGY
jgi:myo-inositol-1(or 4)-monophosphatase